MQGQPRTKRRTTVWQKLKLNIVLCQQNELIRNSHSPDGVRGRKCVFPTAAKSRGHHRVCKSQCMNRTHQHVKSDNFYTCTTIALVRLQWLRLKSPVGLCGVSALGTQVLCYLQICVDCTGAHIKSWKLLEPQYRSGKVTVEQDGWLQGIIQREEWGRPKVMSHRSTRGSMRTCLPITNFYVIFLKPTRTPASQVESTGCGCRYSILESRGQ